jgi:hypothetical protein
MSRVTLLAELEHLTQAARMRRMVDAGRAAISDARMRATLEELASGGFYERGLSLQACYEVYEV